jgi:hypothetical protein
VHLLWDVADPGWRAVRRGAMPGLSTQGGYMLIRHGLFASIVAIAACAALPAETEEAVSQESHGGASCDWAQ